MVKLELKEGIKLQLVESDSTSGAERGTGACGCGCRCGSEQEESDRPMAVVAGGSDDARCEPGCSPETCGGA